MGKWETNIDNTVKNNSAGRVIIGGVAKKVSVVREVVGGVVKQVWNAFDPNLGSFSITGVYASEYNESVTHYSSAIPRSRLEEAISNGYSRITGNYSFYYQNANPYQPRSSAALQFTPNIVIWNTHNTSDGETISGSISISISEALQASDSNFYFFAGVKAAQEYVIRMGSINITNVRFS